MKCDTHGAKTSSCNSVFNFPGSDFVFADCYYGLEHERLLVKMSSGLYKGNFFQNRSLLTYYIYINTLSVDLLKIEPEMTTKDMK